MMRQTLLLAALIFTAGCSRDRSFRTIEFPSESLQARSLDGGLILRSPKLQKYVQVGAESVNPATAADWARARNIVRDEGLGNPIFSPEDGPYPYNPLKIDDRVYKSRGHWKKTLFSTDGAYFALFSYTDLIPYQPGVPGPLVSFLKAREKIGELCVDVYARGAEPNSDPVASSTIAVYRFPVGGFWSWYFGYDFVDGWVEQSAWLANRILVVPSGSEVRIAELPSRPPGRLPYRVNQGLMIASGDPPPLVIRGVREETIPLWRDVAIFHVAVNAEVEGKYGIRTQFDGGKWQSQLYVLRTGPQDLSFSFTRRGARLTGMSYQFFPRHREPVLDGPPMVIPEPVGSALRPPLLTVGRRFEILREGATSERTPGAGFEIGLTLLSLELVECWVDATLRGVNGFSFGSVSGALRLKPGFNPVTVPTRLLELRRLIAGPHQLQQISLNCPGGEIAIAGNVPIPTLDFRGLPGALCQHDRNQDGRVDAADVEGELAGLTHEFPTATTAKRRRTAEYLISLNASCATK